MRDVKEGNAIAVKKGGCVWLGGIFTAHLDVSPSWAGRKTDGRAAVKLGPQCVKNYEQKLKLGWAENVGRWSPEAGKLRGLAGFPRFSIAIISAHTHDEPATICCH